jgi:hypothetical protein
MTLIFSTSLFTWKIFIFNYSPTLEYSELFFGKSIAKGNLIVTSPVLVILPIVGRHFYISEKGHFMF